MRKYYKKHKDYYQRTKDYRKEYNKNIKNNIRKKSTSMKAEQIKCECGCMASRVNFARHRRTKKHEQLLQTMD